MRAGITFENIWFDNDVVELKIVAENNGIKFSNKVYISYPDINSMINDLDVFKYQVHGGIYDMELGMFGPEYANGAFSGRLHFCKPGRVFISLKMQTDYFDFGRKNVANQIILYMTTEPGLLDSFIDEFRSISKEIGNTALLICDTSDF